MAEPLLEVENLTVSFDGFKALDDLSLSVMPGEVRVLIGPNGAGKSTLLDAIIGRVHPAGGRILFKGEDITRLPEYQIVRRGICRKFQTPGVLEGLSVEENLVIAARQRRHWWAALDSALTPGEREQVDATLKLIGLEEKRGRLAAHLAHGEKQWLEIGMVVAARSELLLLDEPAAGMTRHEASLTADLISRLRGQRALVVIDHDMNFVEQLDAPVSVLHMGKLLREGSVAEVRSDPRVAAVYLGRAEEPQYAYA
jgi:urea transport system ATP-binding protein